MNVSNRLLESTCECRCISRAAFSKSLGSTNQRNCSRSRIVPVARAQNRLDLPHYVRHGTNDASPTQQAGHQQAAAAADVTSSCSQQEQGHLSQQLAQPNSQHGPSWIARLICTQTFVGALLAAALVALVMPGRRSMAAAATLPMPWQVLNQRDYPASSSHQYSTRTEPLSHRSSSRDAALYSSLQSTAAAPRAYNTADSYHRDSSRTTPASRHSTTEYSASNTPVTSTNPVSSSSSSSSEVSTSIPSNTLNADTAVAAPPAGPPFTSSSAAAPSSGSSNSTTGVEELLAHEGATVTLFEAARPSVVNITHLRAMQNFYTLDVHKMAVGQGSGFIWDRNGHVITNYHVIRGAAEMKVTLYDHSSCTARVVGYDASKDIAVLKLALPRGRLEALKPVALGSSAGLRVGQAVFAIGNPFGLDHTLTQGIVSGLGREVSAGLSAIKGVIQTDAAINPGNSGGVLLNSKGAVIGINLGILDPSGKGSFSGVGFAIPIGTALGWSCIFLRRQSYVLIVT
eukprot:GHUV01043526.1.p1 GENE.GHUV01043526.1~~GHUV01043526.1.p1  ORF type:complete len:514 (+),score=123.48 GHUV01043526.1:819-2360(+)